MSKYRITPRALNDLKNIGRYTQKQWGKSQRNIYLKKIENRFKLLALNPLQGMHRPDIAVNYYSFPESMHIIFYLINSEYIEIIGIPHKNMDVISYFVPH